MEARMFAEEDRLFRQFAAMEAAMSNMQNQGQWFNSMLGM
jgi:flagellar capping protein FliD